LLCVHNPCEYFWSDILSEQDHARRQARSSASRHARKAGMPEQLAAEQLHLHTHPLLAAWGRQGRDYLALLDTLDQPDSYRQQFERLGERIDIFESHGETRLLNQLQDDIRQLRSLDESRAQWPAVDPASDHSLRFHTAHSTQREVEILQDQLLATFAADPSLRPRDVIVMVPDVNAFAPHIDAVFGQLDASDPRYLPYSIADQESRQQAPLAFALEFLLNLPEARLAVSELFDLLDVAALRQRFGLAAADLPRLRQWIRQSNIRWGLNAAHRQQFMPQATLAAQQQNTWQQGLKRMLLGYALGHDEALLAANHWQSIEAYDEVSGLGAAAVGPLASLLHALESLAQSLAKPAPPAQWGQRLRKLLDDFFLVDTASDQWLLLKFQDSLSDWLAACDAAELTEDLPLNVVRDHWLGQLDSASLTRPFMAGRLTFATLMPMRAIPYRMVCLLGMNDGQFPRSRPPLDFDLMAQDVRPGDRSRREDDRYLFLEALLSAREKLHISWVGRSNLDNSERAPSVLVSQLRDHLQAGWQLAASAASAASTSTATPASPTANLLDALTVKHPLQPFSNAYFVASADSALFTYAAEWERRPAPAAEPESKAECASLHLPLPRLDTPIELDQLAAFLKDPVRHFYHQRLDIRYDAHELAAQEQEDHEPFALDVLQQWSLQDQLIQARLAALYQGADAATEQAVIDHELARMRRAGELPVGSAGDLVTEALCEPLARMFALRAEALVAWPVRLDDQDFSYSYDVAGQSLNITGRLTNLHGQSAQGAAGARCRIEFNSSNLLEGRRYRRDKLLAPWLRHLAMHLLPEAAASGPISSLIIGKNGQVLLQPLPIEQARADFNTLLTHYVQGLCAPLPLAARTGFAWLEKQGQPCQGELADCGQLAAAIEAARNRYHGSSNQSNYGSQGELQYNAYLQQAYPDFARLWSQGRFSQLCADLYGPLLTCVGRSDETAEDKA
ncbi:MAG: exodeoxyribonuclease V subunit gamma, partial [Sterolibacterium sp.]|nr:exodeoxyribonuclease V subunit gamma [Sterolibacterium sp.]